jgi:hypothetical protein
MSDFLPCSELYQIASILVHTMGPADSKRARQGELNTSAGCDVKHNSRHTTGLQRLLL